MKPFLTEFFERPDQASPQKTGTQTFTRTLNEGVDDDAGRPVVIPGTGERVPPRHHIFGSVVI